jgi:hypothetical protein
MNEILDRVKLLVAAMVVGACIIAYAIWGRDNVDPKWIGLTIETAILFGYLFKYNRSLWHCTRFWQVIPGLLVAHSIISILVLDRFQRVPLVAFVIPAVAEGLIYQTIVDRYCPASR